MTKAERFNLIRNAVHKAKAEPRSLTGEQQDWLTELQTEEQEITAPDIVAEFKDEDVREEIHYLDGYRRVLAQDNERGDDSSGLLESDFSLEGKRYAYAVG